MLRKLEYHEILRHLVQVYGPHIAQLYARREIHYHVRPLSHFFNPQDTLSDKLALAGASYEMTQSISTVVDYFGRDLEEAFTQIAAREQKLQSILLSYLSSNPKVTIYGESSTDPSVRVPTISFVVDGRSSKSVVDDVESKSNFGFRNGHMYSHRLVRNVFGIPEKDGVVRISFVHYNSGRLPSTVMLLHVANSRLEDEVNRLVEVLKEVIG